jgi:tRNA pseudouridine38-40 synthase
VRTLKLTISYDGTDFAGWQRQAAARTVQAAIEDALKPIEGGRVIITGAGRTDAGVHAAGQVASVSLESAIPLADLQRALNATLTDDVRVVEIAETEQHFNARFDARAKTYRYSICCEAVMPPPLRRYAWHVPQHLDPAAMNAAAALIVGEHDFSAFQGAGSGVKTKVREIRLSTVVQFPMPWILPDTTDSTALMLQYQVTGTGFLRHMVRNIVGTLVDVGRNRRPVDDMRAVLLSRDRSRASATAPPHGLTLWRVDY